LTQPVSTNPENARSTDTRPARAHCRMKSVLESEEMWKREK
jgi:hypothetical protein